MSFPSGKIIRMVLLARIILFVCHAYYILIGLKSRMHLLDRKHKLIARVSTARWNLKEA